VQEHSARTVTASKEITDRMAAEAQSFAEFMQKANDSEKATLRLEVDKLRRGESQWLQLLVHLLDHVFALYQAGARSGQPNLEAQLGQFQEACRDLVRRVGLAPFEATMDEPFDAERHQVAEGQPAPAPESRVVQTLATGYTFQGQILRRSLVAVQPTQSDEPEISAAALNETATAETDFIPGEAAPIEAAETGAGDADPRAAAADTEIALAMEEDFRLEAEGLTGRAEDERKA
jgi:molecular chaperone GrpE (heat shock protein)